MEGTQYSPTCKIGNAEILSRIRRDPTLHFLQCRPANGSGLPFAAELHLATRPFQEHDELRCHFHGNLSTEILFHQCQGYIPSGSYPPRRSHPSLPHIIPLLL